MAVTFSISPNPHWVVIDNFSKLPIGATIYTFSSLNPSQFKPAFQDAGGAIPYSQPITGFANGTFPPIYWQFDSNDPTDLYYIQVWDKNKDIPGNDAVLLWDFSGLPASGNGGGGGSVTTNFDLENLIVNGEFYRHSKDLPITGVTVGTFETLAPSNHQGFAGAAPGINSAPPSPDIIFAKRDTGATANDTIKFIKFTQGNSDFSPAPTPEIYVQYACTSPGTEAFKVIQFPIVRGLQNINNTLISISMWNQFVGGSSLVQLQLRQFFGNGTNGPTGDLITSLGLLQFSAGNWNKTEITSFTVPSINGATLGNCGNDALFLQILIPSSTICTFNFVLPSVYLGNAVSKVDFHTLDEVSAIVDSPRTGDIRTSINSFSPFGWVPMNDGTIGSATSLATTRADIDTFPLYDLIWNNVPQALAPVSGGPRGVSSIADFGSNRPMSLTRALGRVMAGALPVAASQTFTRTANTLIVTSTAGFYTGMAVTVSSTLTLPSPLTAGTIYFAVVVDATTLSLAINTANATAVSPTVIVLTTAGSGTMTIVSVNSEILGSYIGEESHPLDVTEMSPHSHTFSNVSGGGATLAGGAGNQILSANTGSTGGAGSSSTVGAGGAVVPHNTIQPTVYMNVFIKL